MTETTPTRADDGFDAVAAFRSLLERFPEALRDGGIGYGRRHGHRHGPQIVDMGQKRCSGLAHGDQAGYGACGGGKHPRADPPRLRDNHAEREAGVEHGVIHLRDDVSHSPVSDRAEGTAGGD